MPTGKELTGYPSIDRPWMKYYPEEVTSISLPKCTIYDFMRRQNEGHEKEIALEYFGKKISYGKLLDRIDKAVRAFSALGIKEGDIVSFCTVTTPEIIYAFYALNRLGAVANLIDPRTNAEKIKQYVTSVNSKILITLDLAYPKLEKWISQTCLKKVITVSAGDSMPKAIKIGYRLTQRKTVPANNNLLISWKDFIQFGKSIYNIPSTNYHPDMPAAIVYTGGTTGMPKGAVLSNDALNIMVVLQKYSNTRMERGQKFLGFMPPFIAYGLVCGITNPLSLGLKIIIIPKFDPQKFDRLLMKYKPNHAIGVPSYWESLVKSPKLKKADLSFLTNAITGGDRIDPAAEQEINEFFREHGCKYKLSKGYGMTEFSSTATYSVSDECNLPGSVGIPLFLNNVKIVKPGTQEELSYNKEGEVCMTSPTMMLRYFESDEETRNTLVKHRDGATWVHTQDIGYLNEDGVLFIIDRIKRMIVRHDGFKVFPSKIESIISHNPAVQECAVVGLQDLYHAQGKNPVAFISLRPDYLEKLEEVELSIKTLCEKELPDYSQPTAIKYVQKLPLTPIGKIDYRFLEEKAEP